MQRAAADRFIGTGLELGGCDPVYVRHDANLAHAIENVVDGAYFNSGQSCCGLQRIYVHDRLYDSFVEGFVELTNKYVLGNPLDAATTQRIEDSGIRTVGLVSDHFVPGFGTLFELLPSGG